MYTAEEARRYTDTYIKEDASVYTVCIPKHIDECIHRAAHRGKYEFSVEFQELIDRGLIFNKSAFQIVFEGIEKNLKEAGFTVKIEYPNVKVSW